VLAAIPEGTAERARPEARLELLKEAAGLEPPDELQAKLTRDPGDLETRYRMAVQAAVAGDYARALEEALAILKADRTFRNDLGRLTMIRIFKLMGKGSELASKYRRAMFNFMH